MPTHSLQVGAKITQIHRKKSKNENTGLDFYRRRAARRNEAIALRGIALVETALGSYRDAITHANEALSTFEALGLHLDAAMAHTCLAWAQFCGNDLTAAESSYSEALAGANQGGSTYEAARAETGLGNVAAADGRSADARYHWNQAQEQQITLNPVMVGEARTRLALDGAGPVVKPSPGTPPGRR